MAKTTDRGLENREIVLDILMEVLEKGSFIHVVLGQALEKYQYLDKADRAFITRLAEGTVEYLIQIDAVINRYAKIKTQKMKPAIRNLLRLGVYQILYMDRVPDSAACNEAVKLAAKRRFQGLKGFVNGVLRSVAREKETISFEEPWLRLSLPEWLYRLLAAAYGKERAEKMGEAFLSERSTTVRCNLGLLEGRREEILESLKEQGGEVKEDERRPDILYLKGYDYLEGLWAFQKGWIQPQDLSSALVGQLAPPEPGSLVLDLCAAPGGKSLHMAELLKGTGMVEARDLTPRKIALIEENIERCGFSNIRAACHDARELDPDMEGKADLVIADLPCSGLGILGRKPDIKLNMTPEKLESLKELQREILSVAWRYVKPGGRLVYSTCTVNPAENGENAAWFLEHFPFEPVDLRGKLGPDWEEDSLKEGQIQLLPGIHPADGFFISVFRRRE